MSPAVEAAYQAQARAALLNTLARAVALATLTQHIHHRAQVRRCATIGLCGGVDLFRQLRHLCLGNQLDPHLRVTLNFLSGFGSLVLQGQTNILERRGELSDLCPHAAGVTTAAAAFTHGDERGGDSCSGTRRRYRHDARRREPACGKPSVVSSVADGAYAALGLRGKRAAPLGSPS